MEQAGRSGKQNIAEGYMQQSLETRIKLLGVSRGSLEELLNDYTDFLEVTQFYSKLFDVANNKKLILECTARLN